MACVLVCCGVLFVLGGGWLWFEVLRRGWPECHALVRSCMRPSSSTTRTLHFRGSIAHGQRGEFPTHLSSTTSAPFRRPSRYLNRLRFSRRHFVIRPSSRHSRGVIQRHLCPPRAAPLRSRTPEALTFSCLRLHCSSCPGGRERQVRDGTQPKPRHEDLAAPENG